MSLITVCLRWSYLVSFLWWKRYFKHRFMQQKEKRNSTPCFDLLCNKIVNSEQRQDKQQKSIPSCSFFWIKQCSAWPIFIRYLSAKFMLKEQVFLFFVYVIPRDIPSSQPNRQFTVCAVGTARYSTAHNHNHNNHMSLLYNPPPTRACFFFLFTNMGHNNKTKVDIFI